MQRARTSSDDDNKSKNNVHLPNKGQERSLSRDKGEKQNQKTTASASNDKKTHTMLPILNKIPHFIHPRTKIQTKGLHIT